MTSGYQEPANQSVTLTAVDPFQISSQVRYRLDGYSLDGAPLIYATTVNVVMDKSHTFVWVWHQEFILTLASNFGQPTLSGAGWQPANRSVQIFAPQIFLNGANQYFFKQWFVTSGTATISNPSALNTTVILQTPATVQVQYELVTSSMTNTYTTTITTVVSGSTVTTTSTGVFAHDQVTVQLQIHNQQLNIAGANVTVLDDAGQQVWKGVTDQSGLTQQFQVKASLIYTVKVQLLTQTYTNRQPFPATGTYPIDIATTQPIISLQALGQWIIPIVGLIIGVIALIAYLHSRRGPQRPRTEWVSR